jgi:C4-dicarboxylate-specific signal transduction histidine kinase
MQESWRSAVANQLPFEVEIRQRRADGMFRWCLSRAQPLCDEQGRVIRWYGSITDLDDWKQAQEELRQAQANLARTARLTTMGELTASIAHEVNQPLTAVVTNANACLRWLNHQPPNLEEVHAAIGRIIRDGKRGGDVIARIRGLMKKEPATRTALDVNEIIRETIALLQGDLQGATLRTDLTSGLPHVNADRVQLQQVLLNLTVNAMEAMRPVMHRPHVLSIQTKFHEGRAVLVVVHDTGVGLNSEKTEKLFETFYTTKPEGLGMGLSICRSIIEGHRRATLGRIQRGPRRQFPIHLAHRTRKHSVKPPSQYKRHKPVGTPTVFVVDDDASVCEALSSLVRSIGL